LLLKVSILSTSAIFFAAAGEGAAGEGTARTGGEMILPADPDTVVEAEYMRFKQKGTREALELFIARHTDHPLAERAREDLRRLPE
jgi:hypothetical protein